MKYGLLIIPSLLLVMYVGNTSFGEKKINKNHVPIKIRNYIDTQYKDAQKIKYYIESDSDTTLYEVELSYKKEKLTLTFYEDGTLYELEKKVAFKSIPSPTQANIKAYLTNHYKRYKITSVQFVNPHLHTEFELSVKARDESGAKFYEMYFNEKGEFMHMEEIVVKPIQTLF